MNCTQFYSSGVLDLPQWSEDHAVHAVLITGYGIMKDKKYWLVRNRCALDIAVQHNNSYDSENDTNMPWLGVMH